MPPARRDDEPTVDPLGLVPSQPDTERAAKLVVVKGPDEGLEAVIEHLVEVGSSDRCQLTLCDPAVSRRHLTVTTVGGRVLVKDLGSRNGTFLDGTRLVEAEVQLGSILTLGDSAIMVQPAWSGLLEPSSARSFGALVGRSVAMRRMFALLERAAPTDLPLLIEGETGTGKELVSRSVHEGSPRAAAPYVVVDCGSIPADLISSELFGHKRGAFTGAVEDRTGAFERADGGTILLDEIGELPVDLQPRLLRVLEQREVVPVGEGAARKIDVRVIAATNRDLQAEVRRGSFRDDLLYRLDVVRVRVPPLRRRLEDLPLLVSTLLDERVLPDGVAGANLQRLLGYSWPGNVRELRNVLQRALALAGSAEEPIAFDRLAFDLGPGASEPVTLGPSYPGVATPMEYKRAKALLLASFERAYLDALLARHGGNVARAAAAAGLSRKHLYELMRRAGAD